MFSIVYRLKLLNNTIFINKKSCVSSTLQILNISRRKFSDTSNQNQNNNNQGTTNSIDSHQFKIPSALKSRKSKSKATEVQYFVDIKRTRTIGGIGGDGCASFLSAWCNDRAGPNGGDGGNGGHVVFEASNEVNDLSHIGTVVKGDLGERGSPRDCHGRSAKHRILKVPIGTIVKNVYGQIVGDLNRAGLMFVAARGGAGGRGNVFFVTNTEQAPKICEAGADGEDLTYEIELRCMAHIGLIGLPNAGKSTLLRAITRARPKVASYPFTTLKPHLGMVQYEDYEQIAIADLPGLIPGSHQNKGLGIQFLKHAERCAALLFIIDVSCVEPWKHYRQLCFELEKFSPELIKRPKIIVANKIDEIDAKLNLDALRNKIDDPNVPIIPISAKMGTNINQLLMDIRILYNSFSSDGKNNRKNVDVDDDKNN